MSSIQFFEDKSGKNVPLPLRSTMVTLKSGHRVLFSPIKFNEKDIKALKITPPHALVAPNLLHHLYIKKAADDFKVDNLYGPPGLQQKRPQLEWSIVLGDKTWSYQEDLPMILVEGAPRLNECVFFHKESRTLIVTDLIFNLSGLELNLKNFIFKLFGTFNRPACSRLLHVFVKDKKLFKASLNKILEWDFDRIVMAHGNIIESGGKEIFRYALKDRGFI
jgi:hypothetical protein